MLKSIPELRLKKVFEAGTKKRFIQNNLKTQFLVFGAVNGNFFSLNSAKEKAVNDKFKIKIIPSAHKGAEGNHKMVR